MPTPKDTQTVDDLNQLIEKSAKRGARLALSELGLDDDNAPGDVRDLRNLLVSWRRIRGQAVAAMARLFIHLVLVSMLAMATFILWFNGR